MLNCRAWTHPQCNVYRTIRPKYIILSTLDCWSKYPKIFILFNSFSLTCSLSEIVSEEEKMQILEEELKIVQELISLEESDSVQSKDKVATRKCKKNWVITLKGPILTSNILMQKIGKYEHKIRSNLELLKQLDPIRTSYYQVLEQKS